MTEQEKRAEKLLEELLEGWELEAVQLKTLKRAAWWAQEAVHYQCVVTAADGAQWLGIWSCGADLHEAYGPQLVSVVGALLLATGFRHSDVWRFDDDFAAVYGRAGELEEERAKVTCTAHSRLTRGAVRADNGALRFLSCALGSDLRLAVVLGGQL